MCSLVRGSNNLRFDVVILLSHKGTARVDLDLQWTGWGVGKFLPRNSRSLTFPVSSHPMLFSNKYASSSLTDVGFSAEFDKVLHFLALPENPCQIVQQLSSFPCLPTTLSSSSHLPVQAVHLHLPIQFHVCCAVRTRSPVVTSVCCSCFMSVSLVNHFHWHLSFQAFLWLWSLFHFSLLTNCGYLCCYAKPPTYDSELFND